MTDNKLEEFSTYLLNTGILDDLKKVLIELY